MVNKVVLIGNLGRDPELFHTQSGQPVARLSLATNKMWAKNGERQRRTARSAAFLRSPATRLQRSTVKASYARNRRGTSWRAHGVYLAREGAQREGERGLGFDAERADVDLGATLREWQTAGDERLWKFVVSPEHAASLDLREHARELVDRMQRDLGSRLEWVAIDHYNTDNPHVHLLVRGRGLDGHSLRIPRDYGCLPAPPRRLNIEVEFVVASDYDDVLRERSNTGGRQRQRGGATPKK